MAWSEQVHEELLTAFSNNEHLEFERLLKNHSDNLRFEDGTELWMHLAARRGQIHLVKLLVDLGIDINEPRSTKSADDGAIREAARYGHLDLVRWFLDNGAEINFDSKGQQTCNTLSTAASGGHLDVVKLLVEGGANIHASKAGMNALMLAEMSGHHDVAEYLRSLGAKDVRDTTPPDYPAAHETIRRHVSASRGGLDSLEFPEATPGDPPVVVHVTQPDEDDNSRTLFTVGMSDRNIALPTGEVICTELSLMLPADWPLTADAQQDPRYAWPIEWLHRLARQALDADHWSGDTWAAFPNGDPAEPFAPDTQLSVWLCLLGQTGGIAQTQAPDYRWIDIRSLFAIYEEEYEFLLNNGYEELVKQFHEREVPMYLDPQRENVCG